MPTELSTAEAVALGIKANHSKMDNGECRFRLMDESSGTGGYIMTVMPKNDRGWQNSHYHEGLLETYIVQKGWIGFAELLPGNRTAINIYRPGALFTSRPGLPHNVYMSAGTVIHTVKHGDCTLQGDWHASAELDALTKRLSEEDIFAAAKLSRHMIAELRDLAA